MALLPEFVFRAVLTRGIKSLRRDGRYLDQLFMGLDQQSLGQMRSFLREQLIHIDINYPRDKLALPAIIILLRSENEEQGFLGDSMGVDQVPDSIVYDDLEGLETLGGTASVSTLSGLGPLVYGPDTAASATANTLTTATNVWEIDELMTSAGRTVRIIQGTGAGQQRAITANNQRTLMVSPNWHVIPDATSVFDVRGAADAQAADLFLRLEAGGSR